MKNSFKLDTIVVNILLFLSLVMPLAACGDDDQPHPPETLAEFEQAVCAKEAACEIKKGNTPNGSNAQCSSAGLGLTRMLYPKCTDELLKAVYQCQLDLPCEPGMFEMQHCQDLVGACIAGMTLPEIQLDNWKLHCKAVGRCMDKEPDCSDTFVNKYIKELTDNCATLETLGAKINITAGVCNAEDYGEDAADEIKEFNDHVRPKCLASIKKFEAAVVAQK